MERYHWLILPQTRGVDVGGGGVFGDLRGLLYTDPESGGMPGVRMSGKGKHSRETAGALHVLTLEGYGGNFTGGNVTAPAV